MKTKSNLPKAIVKSLTTLSLTIVLLQTTSCRELSSDENDLMQPNSFKMSASVEPESIFEDGSKKDSIENLRNRPPRKNRIPW